MRADRAPEEIGQSLYDQQHHPWTPGPWPPAGPVDYCLSCSERGRGLTPWPCPVSQMAPARALEVIEHEARAHGWAPGPERQKAVANPATPPRHPQTGA